MADPTNAPVTAGGETVSASASGPAITETALTTYQAPRSPIGAAHLAGIAGAGYAGNQLLTPLIDYGAKLAHLGIMPDDKVESSLATLISLGVALLVVRVTRGRAGLAAYLTGDSNAISTNS